MTIETRNLRRPTSNLPAGAELRQFLAHCVCVVRLRSCELRRNFCGRKKLPFAGYSVVKELTFEAAAVRLWRAACATSFSSNLSGCRQERFRSTDRIPILRPAITRDQAGPFRLRCLRQLRRDSLLRSSSSSSPSWPTRRAGPAEAARSAAKAGGEYRARTGDLLVANQALSQLS